MSRASLLPEPVMVPDIDQAIYLASREFRGGITALAYTVAVDPGTFQKKVSLTNTTHRLSLHEFLAVADATDDARIDEAYARLRGKVLFTPRPVPATRQALAALAGVMRAESEFVDSLQKGLADEVWEDHEVAVLEHHAHVLIGNILGILAGAREAAEGRRNG